MIPINVKKEKKESEICTSARTKQDKTMQKMKKKNDISEVESLHRNTSNENHEMAV